MQQNMSTSQIQQKTLRFDINSLLIMYNQIDRQNIGFIDKKSLKIIFDSLGIAYTDYAQLKNYKNVQLFQFDSFLSILGQIQVPHESSIYTISFVKILSGYRNKCIEKGDQGLEDAKVIDEKIKKIMQRELQRQKQRLLSEHNKIYEEMNRSQYKQFMGFEEQWKKYLDEFRLQSHDRINKTKTNKLKQLSTQTQKMIEHGRKNILVTSPKIRQFSEKKKWLVREGQYNQAIKINNMIEQEKKRLQQNNEQHLQRSVRKKIQSLKKKNEVTMDYIQMEMKTNMNKLLFKKQEGQNIMRIRMKSLRSEAQKKLNDHLRSQLLRLRSSFQMASKY